MSTYMEQMLPAYFMKYLSVPVSIGPATFASMPPKDPHSPWLDYLLTLRQSIYGGWDSVVMGIDVPGSQVDLECPRCAGENLFLDYPNTAWATVVDWEYIGRNFPYNRWREVELYGPRGDGIDGLLTMGHETTHFVLLKLGGPAMSAEIDGGRLSGIVRTNEALDPDPNGFWAFQRVREDQPYHGAFGAYHL
ncbi:MAG: hypothetical protein ACP5LG_06540 [Conexivisphaera sp.]